jgi:hypothetical protein
MMYPEVSGIVLAVVTILGIAWYVEDFISKKSKEEKDPIDFIPTEVQEPLKADELQDMGTGPMVEEMLGNEIAKAQMRVFIVGAVNETVFKLLRHFMAPNLPLQIMTNANFGKIYLHEIRTKFSSEIKNTESIKGGESGGAPTITTFNIDGRIVLIFNSKDHSVIMANQKSTVDKITAPQYSDYKNAQVYNP